MQNKKNTIIAAVIAVIVIAILIACYGVFMPKAAAGDKNITVTVYHSDGTEARFDINTSGQNLRTALEEQKLIQGDDSGPTLFVTTVDGYTADSANEEWWCFTKGGEDMMTGVDDTMIADGDAYEITLKVGYDW